MGAGWGEKGGEDRKLFTHNPNRGLENTIAIR